MHPLAGEAERKARLLDLVDRFAGRRVLVLGDLVADEFIYGQVSRVSREAPVLILKYDTTQVVAGGAGNAANNVAALGGAVRLMGLVGRDEPGRRMLKSLHPKIDARRVLRPADWRTPIKTRILAGGIHSAKQQVVRIDREGAWEGSRADRRELQQRVIEAVETCDGVVISDYGLGLVTPDLVSALQRRAAARSRRRQIPVLIDSRYNLLGYRGLTACTPNEAEVEQMLGVSLDDDPAAVERAGRAILRRTGMQAVLITRGSRGMMLFEPGVPTVAIAIYGSDEIADVTGAGDTVIATMAVALAGGASFYEASRLANYAGGLVVMKRGTATVTAAELSEAIEHDHPTPVEHWSQEGPEQGRRS
ncbi:MAG TPA: PfkB family carbohydrate kinase [Vicinamibacterales bacterium]